MPPSKYKNIAISHKCNALLDLVKEKEGILKGFAVERALIEKYPELAKEVGLK